MHLFQVGFAADGWRNGAPVEALLRRIVDEGVVVASTGAEALVPGEWTTSAVAEPIEGGYRINARKAFCSQAPVMDIVRLNARDADTGEILVISVPASSEGVSVEQTWDTMGMRATESHHVSFENVEVPETAVGARLPAESPAQTPALAGVATWFLSLMSSVYLGIAEEARSLALELAGTGNNSRFRARELTDTMIGEMETSFRTAEAVREQIIGELDQDRSDPQSALRRAVLAKDSIIANAERTVDQALQLAGAQAYFRESPLERLARDMRAARFHPPAAPTSMQMVGQRVSE